MLKDILSELEPHLAAISEEKGIQFSVHHDCNEATEYLYGDKDNIQLAVVNIIYTIIRHSDFGNISCWVKYRNGLIDITVSDTGYSDIESIINLMKNRNSNSPYRDETLPLGISIAQTILSAMNGEITSESIIGSTTDVSIRIPVTQYEPEKEIANLSHFAVLLVDDNRVNCELLSLMIEKMGCSTALAFNGLEAVQIHKKHKYDLILMDIQMPIMDGFTATEEIRKFDTQTPIVAVTANADYLSCINGGMDDHLAKPVNYDHLKEILVRLLH